MRARAEQRRRDLEVVFVGAVGGKGGAFVEGELRPGPGIEEAEGCWIVCDSRARRKKGGLCDTDDLKLHVEGPLVEEGEVAEHGSSEVYWFADDGDDSRVDVAEDELPDGCHFLNRDYFPESVRREIVDVDDEALDLSEKIVGAEECEIGLDHVDEEGYSVEVIVDKPSKSDCFHTRALEKPR